MKFLSLIPNSLAKVAVVAGFMGLLSAARATTITAWTFENNSVAVNNTPAPSTGVGTASSIGMDLYPTPNVGVTTDDVLVGKSTDTGANSIADTTQNWRVRGQAGSSGAANGWSSLAPIGTQGAQFAASTAGYNSITVSFDWYSTTQGEANLQFLYTTDGLNWSNAPLTLSGSDAGLTLVNNNSSPNTVIGSYVRNNLLLNGTPAGQDWFTGLTATLSDPAAANNPNFAIRMVNASTGADCVSSQGTALNNTSGNWRFDNVTISGTAGSAKTTPTFTGLTASQSLVINTASISLVGRVSAAGPLYPTNTESVIVSINGTSRTNTFTDATGDFSVTFPTAAFSAGNYPISYSYAGDGALNAAVDSSTALTVTNIPVVSTLPPVRTVFVIAMENHNWTQPSPGSSPQQVVGNVAAPYVNSLVTPGNPNAAQVSYATHYYNVGVGVHGSEPNYVWAEAGTDFGVHTDNDPSAGSGNIFTVPHLTAQLNTAGITWKNYQEDVQYSSGITHSASGSGAAVNPYNGSTQYDYGVKHNPMAFFSDTQTQNTFPLTNFLNHLTNNLLGRYNWITPDEFNNMHSALSGGFTYRGTAYTGDQAAIAQGDNFLSKIVPQIMASPAYQNNGLIVIWWDESEGGDTTSQTIGEIIISPLARGNASVSTLEFSHSSDVKTMEEIFGLTYLSNSIPAGETRAAGTGINNVATVNDLSDLLVSLPAIRVQQPAGGTLVNGSATVDFGSVIVGSNTVAKTFAVTNAGSASLIVSGIALSGANPADFSLTGIALPATVNAAGSTTFQVAFTPSTSSVRAATLQITNSDATASPFVVNLAGQGSVVTPTSFTGSKISATNGFNLSFTVGANQAYRVLAADRMDAPLSNWTQVASGIAVTNPVNFADPNLLNARFYRVVSP